VLADRSADRVDSIVFGPGAGEWSPTAIEAGYALAMLLLHYRVEFTEAADRFGRLYRGIPVGAKDGRIGARLWPARFHEGYSLFHAGELERSREILVELRDLPPAATAGLGPELREHTTALLSQLASASRQSRPASR
jgi:hypothetical protein